MCASLSNRVVRRSNVKSGSRVTALAATFAEDTSNPDFVSTWDTTKAGSASDTIVLPMTAGVATVDWGDGTINTSNTHTYAVGGIKTISITGTIEGFRFANSGDKLKILEVSNWGTFNATTDAVFDYCSNLDVTATDAPTLSHTSMKRFFRYCALTTPDLTSWDTSGVTNMEGVFHGCASFNGDVSNWDTSNVTSFGVNNAGTVSAMFRACTVFNGDISAWNTSSAISFYHMFYDAKAFNQDISGWDVSSVTNFSETFSGASSFNQSLSSWNPASATIMYRMFEKAVAFNSPLFSHIGNVTSLVEMFTFAYDFNQDISGWDVSNVTDFYGMFRYASDFNQDLSSWNMSSATRLGRNYFGARGMFADAPSYDQDMSSWDINQVTDFYAFCKGVTLSTANYDALLIAWDAQGAMSFSGTVDFGTSKYTSGGAAEAARTSLISKWGAITDGGPV